MISAQVASQRTLVSALLPRTTVGKVQADLFLALIFSGIVALSSQVRLHLTFTPVPITGQTFAVLFTGAVLGGRRAVLAMCLYLGEGAVGLPVFAGGVAGIAYLYGPTGGYLLSYPLAAGCAGLLAERGWDRTPARAAVAMTLASLPIFLIGVCWLSPFVGGLGSALGKGLWPFLPGDAAKIALASLLLPVGWKLVGADKRKNASEDTAPEPRS